MRQNGLFKIMTVTITALTLTASSVPTPPLITAISSTASCLAPQMAQINPPARTTQAEKSFGAFVANALNTPIPANQTPEVAANLLKGGYGEKGYGTPQGAAVNGTGAMEGIQGYGTQTGRKHFVDTVGKLTDFYKSKDFKYVMKIGIGGQHTPFQGIADMFTSLFPEKGIVSGEYELGTDMRKNIANIMVDNNLNWRQINVVVSSKSGSTDETMIIFVQVFRALLEQAAAEQGFDASTFSKAVLDSLHDLNFVDGKEKKELFADFSLDAIANRAKTSGLDITAEQTGEIIKSVLENIVFETTDRASSSRLAAFIRRSGLDKLMGEKAPVFNSMFDNVGGRWTADLHMMTLLGFYGIDAQKYISRRFENQAKVNELNHPGIDAADEILDNQYTDIALIVPDNAFWVGKSQEQNFNESIWQNGFANLVTIRKSQWKAQQHHYAKNRTDGKKPVVLNLTNLSIAKDEFNTIQLDALGTEQENPEQLALDFADLFSTLYAITNRVGTRLIARALMDAGLSLEDIQKDSNFSLANLDHPATKIIQENLFLRQPFVELGKALLQEELTKLQELKKTDPEAITKAMAALKNQAENFYTDAAGFDPEVKLNANANADQIAQFIISAVKQAEKTNRKLVPYIYLEGPAFSQLRDRLIDLGYEWIMQGTGDQHISYQQVLAQPDKYLPLFVSMVSPTPVEAAPAIGFAKGYLDEVSPDMVRDYFAKASFEALRNRNGMGCFIRMLNIPQNRQNLQTAFQTAAQSAYLEKLSTPYIQKAVAQAVQELKNPTDVEVVSFLNTKGINLEATEQSLTALGKAFNLVSDKEFANMILANPGMLKDLNYKRIARLTQSINRMQTMDVVFDENKTQELLSAVKASQTPLACIRLVKAISDRGRTAGDRRVKTEAAKKLNSAINPAMNMFLPVEKKLFTKTLFPLLAKLDRGQVKIDADMFKAYDYRSVSAHARKGKTIEETGMLLAFSWAEMALDRAEKYNLDSRTVLLGKDGRKKNPRFIAAVEAALVYSGFNVVYAAMAPEGVEKPMSVSSYSAAVRMSYENPVTNKVEKPLFCVFNTASHVSRPIDPATGLDVVVGCKVAMAIDEEGTLASLTTAAINETSKQIVKDLIAEPTKISSLENATQGALTTNGQTENTFIEETSLIVKTVAAFTQGTSTSLAELDSELESAKDIRTVLRQPKWLKIADQINKPLEGINVVIEAANTVSGEQSQKVLCDRLGATLTKMLNGEVKDIAGKHMANPAEEANLTYEGGLDDTLRANPDVHFGLAYDLDGDRVVIRYQDKNGNMVGLPPDLMMAVLLPYLIEKGGYNPNTLAVIRDVLGTEAINKMAESLGVDVHQTDAGYVFLKDLKRKLEAQGKTVLLYGESSGHGWLRAAGDIENPISLVGIFSLITREFQHENPNIPASQLVASMLEQKLAFPFKRSGRFKPKFHQKFLERIYDQWFVDLDMDSKLDMGIENWDPRSADPEKSKPLTAIITQGKHMAIDSLSKTFAKDKKFNTPMGTIKVLGIQANKGTDGRYQFADIRFGLENDVYIGRFVFRASSNDPNFVASFEVPEYLKLPQDMNPEALFRNVSGLVLTWLEGTELSPVSSGVGSTQVSDTYAAYSVNSAA